MSADNTSSGNGNGAAATAAAPHIVITVADMVTFSVQLQVNCPSLDYALNMLAQATREIEAQWRLQRAAAFQKQQLEIMQEQQIRDQLRRSY
ncbi:MAG TPA: hypothetical protein VE779_08110 [Candidatus Angelobacter sp.]|jgi:hypothetical protein|nr:hypothetical protein [Candidatus Angelobacter sp.]